MDLNNNKRHLRLFEYPFFAKHKTIIPTFLLTNISIANNLMFDIEIMVVRFCEAAVTIYQENNKLETGFISYDYLIEHGEFSILLYRSYKIVNVISDQQAEITKEDAQKKNQREIIDGKWINYIKFKIEFDRKSINKIKNLFMKDCIDMRNAYVYNEMIHQKNKIILGNIELVNNQFAKIKHKNVYGFLPRKNQIPNEQLEEGQNIEVFVADVVKDPIYSFPLVFSRTEKEFMHLIFIDEVPEIADGIIEIKCIEWIPSVKAKIGLYSTQDIIDPIGSCIGQRGDRISSIAQRLNNEKIDLFVWDDDKDKLLINLFHPIKILEVEVDDNGDNYSVKIDRNDMNFAIGKYGSNIKLISRVMNALVTVTCDESEDEA